jgi:hypothetical protein
LETHECRLALGSKKKEYIEFLDRIEEFSESQKKLSYEERRKGIVNYIV